MKRTILRGFIFFFGLFLKSFGFSCIILSNLGTGAWEALYVGLSRKIGLSVGVWLILFGTFIILINAFLLKHRPTFMSLLTVLFLGGLIDLWLHGMGGHILDLWKQIIVFGLGLLFAAVGVAIYVQAEFALTPLDQLMYALSQRMRTNLMIAKTTGELMALILAIALQGPVGIGTIVFTLLFGFLIQWFMVRIEHILSF